jgi:HEAT repeat protein
VDQRSLNVAMLELGAKRRYADVITIARQSGWKGDDMARLLGAFLRTPDPAVRRDAMRLLEYSGPAAAPALDQIILALEDSDKEIRYLAARSIEAIGTNSPQVIAALRIALDDEHEIVRNVARRALTKLAPNELLPLPADPARN